MKKILLSTALKMAKIKLPGHPELNRYAHFSFIVQKNKIVEWATNAGLEPPLHYGYHRSVDDPTFVPKFHAEVFAYRRARGLIEDSGFEIINIRLNKTGEVRISCPCKTCFNLMKAMGCRKFYYSSNVGFLSLKT